jgi:hypothetical protein
MKDRQSGDKPSGERINMKSVRSTALKWYPAVLAIFSASRPLVASSIS